MRTSKITREQALELLRAYNTEAFHIQHALTVEGVMRWYADELGYGDEADYWAISGLLHDIDFEMYPEEHCQKAPELLEKGGVGEDMIYTVCSLTGLIWAAALMRPSKSVMDMEVSSVKKKFKDKRFAAGCSRDVIKTGAERLGWELNELFEKTILAMRSCEASVQNEMNEMGL